MSKRHYIFGYGSLINSTSRRLTGIAGDSLAVRVQGLERTWVGWKDMGMRAVAARPMLGACCNGVLFEVPETELEKERYAAALRRRQLALIIAGKMAPEDASELKALFYPEASAQ